MNFAFGSTICPAWDFETLAARAKEFGYDGVELSGSASGTAPTGANVYLTEPAKISRAMASAGVQVACLGSAAAFVGARSADAESAQVVRQAIAVAGQLDCRVVKVTAGAAAPGSSAMALAVALGDWLLPLGDFAAERGVTVVVENALAIRTARQMWAVLDRLRHPAIACSWDVLAAALAGEGPLVSVPMLNSKIQYARIADAKITGNAAAYANLGEGDVQARKFITRLQGIGYGGYVTVDNGVLPSDRGADEMLSEAIKRLREWTTPPAGAKPAHKRLVAAAK